MRSLAYPRYFRQHLAVRAFALVPFLALSSPASTADALKPAAQNAISARFVVTDDGAQADGTTLNTTTIQATIDRCARAGGGEVVIPSGIFLSGALFFKQGVNLRVEKGGVLKATSNQKDFPPVYTRWEGVERYWTSAFLNFVGMADVTVQGEGLIDGSGDAWPNRRARDPATAGTPVASRPASTPAIGPAFVEPPPQASQSLIDEIYGVDKPKTAALNLAKDPANLPNINVAGCGLTGAKMGRPRTLVFQDCRKVQVKDLNFKNEASWCVVFIYCEDAVAEHLTIRAEHNLPSSDGIDIDSCRRVRVTSCNIDCNDDCISIKSGRDEDGRRVNRPCEDIVIEKTRFAYGHGGAAMGSETSGGIRNVEIRDCIADEGNWAPIRFKSQPSRGGVVENITYRNLEIRNAVQALEFTLEWRMVPPLAPAAKVLPVVRNIRLINVHGTTKMLGTIHGLKDSPILGVIFENCVMSANTGLKIENARDVDTAGLKAEVKEGPVLITQKER